VKKEGNYESVALHNSNNFAPWSWKWKIRAWVGKLSKKQVDKF